MLPGGCEVQAEQPSDLPAYPVRFKPLLDGTEPLSHRSMLSGFRKRLSPWALESAG
jgi:hypothetical protein